MPIVQRITGLALVVVLLLLSAPLRAAVSFNGTTSVVDHGNSSSLEFATDTTIAVWFRSAAGDSTGRRLVSKRTSATSFIDVTIADYAGANTIEAGRSRATTEQVVGADAVFTTSQWTLLIVVFTTGDFPRMYVGTEATPVAEVSGGSYDYTDVGSGAVDGGAGSFYLVGKRSGINSINGAIARIGMWAHAFSAGERTALWTANAAAWAAISDCQLVSAYSGTGSQTDLCASGNTGSATDITNVADPSFPTGGGGPTLRNMTTLGVGQWAAVRLRDWLRQALLPAWVTA